VKVCYIRIIRHVYQSNHFSGKGWLVVSDTAKFCVPSTNMCFTYPCIRPENLRRSVDLINEKLRGTKRLDLYESARVDPEVPIEDAIQTLADLVKKGKFDHIGMSECKADTLRRANTVCLSGYYVAFVPLTTF